MDLGIQASTGQADHPLLSEDQVAKLVGLAKLAGASVISTSANWSVLQPDPSKPFNWSGLDEVVKAARERNMKVRVQLVGMPRWAQDQVTGSDYKPPLTPKELARWAHFVTKVVDHEVDDVTYFEVWNEPNDPTYWSTGPDPAAFVRLLGVTDRVVHAAKQSAVVVSGGLAGNDIGFLQHMYTAIKKQGLGATPFDMLGVHPYSGDLAPGVVAPGREYPTQFGMYDENFTGFRQLHEVMATNGDADKQIYIGEFGYSTQAHGTVAAVPDATRAGYLIDAFRAVTCSPYVAAFSWYYLHPTPYDAASWTLLNPSFQPNLTYAALQKWHSYVIGATP